jgi:hypothetical protein
MAFLSQEGILRMLSVLRLLHHLAQLVCTLLPPLIRGMVCERLLGTIQRECLGFLILLTECHPRPLLTKWVPHYNEGRPHLSLGPRIPELLPLLPAPPHEHRHRIPVCFGAVVRPILGGVHHEYRLGENAV